MKRIFVILATLAIGTTAYAQTQDSLQNLSNQDQSATDQATLPAQTYAGNTMDRSGSRSFYNFDNAGEPKEIRTLGSNPEFPFLAHMSSSAQVYRAMKKNSDNSRLNNIIMSLGFANGVQDLQASNITPATIPGGTTGNMGSGSGTTGYYKLVGDNGFKAWKVTGDGGNYVFFLAACGNEFYPNAGKPAGTACVTAPVNVTSQPVEITANGQQTQVTDRVFVYYHVKRMHKHRVNYTNSEIADNHPSKPLLLSTTTKSELVPETYKVTVNTQDQNITVCPDSTANVAANINVEKESTYTGYYPNKTENKYNKITKREYKRAERKMRKAERKEEKVARITSTPVETMEYAPAKKNS